MEKLKEIFNEEFVDNTSDFVNSKMSELNNLPEFKKQDELLSTLMEEIEQKLPEDLKSKFQEMLKANYDVEKYYFTLAYLLGAKHGK